MVKAVVIRVAERVTERYEGQKRKKARGEGKQKRNMVRRDKTIILIQKEKFNPKVKGARNFHP